MNRLGKFFWVLLIPAAIMADPVKFKSVKDAVNCDLVLSEPRSGANWLTWCWQNLTRQSICNPQFEYDVPVNNPLGLWMDETKRPLVRLHEINWLKKADPTQNRLILLFRNYKENTIRRYEDNASKYKKKLNKGTLFDKQAAKLRLYDSWPKESRYLVYYEDLMENPRETLAGLLHFLDESDERLEDFLADLDMQKAKSLAAYEKNTKEAGIGGPISKGKSTSYHSEKVPKKLLLQADDLFKARYPYIWRKYLTRYSSS